MAGTTKPRLWRDRLREDLRRPGFRKKFEAALEEIRIAEEIARARQAAGLSQAELGRAVGTTQSVISRIEKGQQNLTLETLSLIARALGRRVVIHLRPLHARA